MGTHQPVQPFVLPRAPTWNLTAGHGGSRCAYGSRQSALRHPTATRCSTRKQNWAPSTSSCSRATHAERHLQLDCHPPRIAATATDENSTSMARMRQRQVVRSQRYRVQPCSGDHGCPASLASLQPHCSKPVVQSSGDDVSIVTCSSMIWFDEERSPPNSRVLCPSRFHLSLRQESQVKRSQVKPRQATPRHATPRRATPRQVQYSTVQCSTVQCSTDSTSGSSRATGCNWSPTSISYAYHMRMHEHIIALQWFADEHITAERPDQRRRVRAHHGRSGSNHITAERPHLRRVAVPAGSAGSRQPASGGWGHVGRGQAGRTLSCARDRSGRQ